MHLMNIYTILFGITLILGNASFYLKRDKGINKIISQAIIVIVYISYIIATYLSVTHLLNNVFKSTIVDYISVLFPLIFLCVIYLSFSLTKVRKFKNKYNKIKSLETFEETEMFKNIINKMQFYSYLTSLFMSMNIIFIFIMIVLIAVYYV